MASEEGISPWRNAKPRKPIDAFAKEMKTNSPLTVGESPPSSGYKESTRVGTSFEQSSSSMHESSQLELSGASPALLRSEERGGGSKMRPIKVANFTKIRKEARNNSKTKKTKAKYSDNDPLSDDDQPSGNCYYVGESSNVSMSSTVNKTKTNRTNPDLTPPTPSKGSSVCACIWVVIVASISIVVMTVVRDSNWDSSSILSSSPSSSAEHWKQVRQSVSAELSSLKIQFPNQTAASWRVIGATLKSPLHPLPDYPGVLLVVSNRSQASLSSCLASKLVQTSSRALLSPAQPLPTTDSLIIRASDLTNLDPDTAKRQLTESLHTSLDTSSTAALLDLADLHPTAALTLHAFADNSNAPYKQAVLVLTLTGDLEMEQTGNCKLETRVERLLAGLWREELGVDKFSALISRIVVSVVELQPERQDICG